MLEYLFIFGYESPEEWRVNQSQATDFESSSAVWIVASDPEVAQRAGHCYADRWVNDLFLKQGIETYPGWAASGFAHWIELEPLHRFSGMALEMLDRIEA